MNKNEKSFDYDVLWNEVRDRVLNHRLVDCKELLAINDDEIFENIRSDKTLKRYIKAMVRCSDTSFLKHYTDLFETHLYIYLEDCRFNSVLGLETSAIGTVWFNILFDIIQQNTVD